MFYNLDDFPELRQVQDKWKEIRDEALQYVDSFRLFEGKSRNPKSSWYNIPLKPLDVDIKNWEMEGLVSDWAKKCPITRDLCESIDSDGYIYILLDSLGYVGSHSDNTHHVTALLGLDVKEPNVIRCGKKFEKIRNGEFTIFDYTVEHESWNFTDKHRLVLAIAIYNRNKKEKT